MVSDVATTPAEFIQFEETEADTKKRKEADIKKKVRHKKIPIVSSKFRKGGDCRAVELTGTMYLLRSSSPGHPRLLWLNKRKF